jgi:plasmid stabilization system protein ParE
MRVSWTETARGHLRAIHDYIAKDSPEYALLMIDRITRRSQQIAQFPRSGRRVPEYDSDEIREVIVRGYRLIYRIRTEQVDVLAVIHGARDLGGATQLPNS